MRITSIKPRYVLLVAILVLIASYAVFQARFLILGPRVWITNLKDGQTVDSPVVIVTGRAKNVAWISFNDRQIFTDENGEWSEKLIVSTGTSIITVKAQDRLGRKTEKSLQVVLK